MTDKMICRRTDTVRAMVWLRSESSVGMDLGELRAAVAAAEGMPDTANVYVSGVTQSATYVDRRWVRELHIETERGVRTWDGAGNST